MGDPAEPELAGTLPDEPALASAPPAPDKVLLAPPADSTPPFVDAQAPHNPINKTLWARRLGLIVIVTSTVE
jgi:hypothetical protein